MNGIGLAWGAAVRHGILNDARLEDLAPTILHLMGQPIPAHMDGRLLLEILTEQACLPPPQEGTAWKGKQPSNKELSQDEQERIRRRLKDLGYVA
jgi:arylsulfatase A-like enzyme